MVRVGIPDDLSAGVIDLRSYGEGQVEIQSDDAGRYIETDNDQAAAAVADAYPWATIEPGDEPEPEPEPEADEDADEELEEPTCDVTLGSGERCGRDLPCQYHGMEGV